jgi:5-methylcytosine-specific restriction endonuclease McrA
MKASKDFPKIKTVRDKEARKQQRAWRRKQKRAASRHGWRLKTFIKQHGICHYCNYSTPWDFWTVDHKIPISKGGTSSKGNMVGACNACNSKKGNNLFMPSFYT